MKHTVCENFDSLKTNYNYVKAAISTLKKYNENSDFADALNDVDYYSEQMFSDAEDMRTGAESMEKRLDAYRSAIEKLGFERVKVRK